MSETIEVRVARLEHLLRAQGVHEDGCASKAPEKLGPPPFHEKLGKAPCDCWIARPPEPLSMEEDHHARGLILDEVLRVCTDTLEIAINRHVLRRSVAPRHEGSPPLKSYGGPFDRAVDQVRPMEAVTRAQLEQLPRAFAADVDRWFDAMVRETGATVIEYQSIEIHETGPLQSYFWTLKARFSQE